MQLLNGYTELSYTSRRRELEESQRGDLKSICNRFLRVFSFDSVDDSLAATVFLQSGHDFLNPSVRFCPPLFSTARRSVVLLESSHHSHHLLLHHPRIEFEMTFIINIIAGATFASRCDAVTLELLSFIQSQSSNLTTCRTRCCSSYLLAICASIESDRRRELSFLVRKGAVAGGDLGFWIP